MISKCTISMKRDIERDREEEKKERAHAHSYSIGKIMQDAERILWIAVEKNMYLVAKMSANNNGAEGKTHTDIV